jgi:NAD(P)-dependent dehydrogenase (short-subunit alcohol dehydrogenase family)
MGLAAAILFAAEGAHVALNDIHSDNVQRAAESIREGGGSVIVCAGDASGESFANATVAQVIDRFGRVDVLLSNAGVATYRPAVEYTEWDNMIRINLTAHFHWARAVAIQSMIPNRSGAIVTTASIAGHMAYPGDVGYIAAKAGLMGLTRALAIEWSPYNIRVNCVCPGLTESPMVKEVERINPERFALRRKRTPLGRTARPAEIADAMAYLASDAASYVTGISMNVDGGQVAMNSGFSPA